MMTLKKWILSCMLALPLTGLTAEWYVDASVASSGAGTSPATAKKTIQEGINAASAGDTVWVNDGTYYLSSELSITTDITVSSINGAESTIVDGGGAVCCLNMTAGTVSGLTLQNGSSSYGGGAYLNGTTLNNCIVRNNNCSGNGGGLNVISANINNCLIYDNSASGSGAGIQAYGASSTGRVSIRNCTISQNTSGSAGGGLYVTGSNGAFIYNSIIWGNNASSDYNYSQNGSYMGYFYYTLVSLTDGYFESNVQEGCITSGQPYFVSSGTGDFSMWPEWSPCIDTGNNGYVSGTTDVLENSRILDGTVDMGAIEYKPAVSLTNSFVDASQPNDKNDGDSWENAAQTIDTALENTVSNGAVWVTNGTYTVSKSAFSEQTLVLCGADITLPGGYRYYRFTAASLYTGSTMQFSELQYFQNNTWVQASAVDYTGEDFGDEYGEGPDNANDNDTETKFCTDDPYQSLIYDFGTAVNLDEYNWCTGNDLTPDRNPLRWTIEGSLDNSTWTVVDDRSGSDDQNTPTSTYQWAGGSAHSRFEGYALEYGSTENVRIRVTADSSLDLTVADSTAFGPLSFEGAPEGTVLTVYGTEEAIDDLCTLWGAQVEITATDYGTSATFEASGLSILNVYVDAAQGDDTDHGQTWEYAKQTMEAAIDAVEAGGTVWVTNGTYSIVPDDLADGDTARTLGLCGATVSIAKPANYQYYRFSATKIYDDGTELQYSELQYFLDDVWAQADSAAYSGSSFADSGWDEGPEQANDNDTGTKFGSAEPLESMTYDFGSATELNEYNWCTGNDSTPDRNPVRWIVEGSSDSNSWVTLDARTAADEDTPTTTYTWAGGSSTRTTGYEISSTDAVALSVIDVIVTADSTLELGNASAATLGSLSFDAPYGTVLTVTGTADAIDDLVAAWGAIEGIDAKDTGTTAYFSQSGDTYNQVYVDGSQSNDSGAGLSWATAKQTLAAGVDTVNPGGTIWLTNGTFAVDTTTMANYNAYGITFALCGAELNVEQAEKYRYYRFGATHLYSSGTMQFSELQYFLNNSWVTASSVDYTGEDFADEYGEGPNNANDNNTETKFCTDDPYKYLVYDFGSSVFLDEYNWCTANDLTPDRNPLRWTIEGSTDNSTWTMLDDRTGSDDQDTPTSTYQWAGGSAHSRFTGYSLSSPAAVAAANTGIHVTQNTTMDLELSSAAAFGLLSFDASGMVLTVTGTTAAIDDLVALWGAQPLVTAVDYGTYATFTSLEAQTISDFLPADGNTFDPTDTVDLSATASSGLTVTFSSAGDDIVSWSDADTVTFTGEGTVQMIASQSGNSTYAAATPVTNIWTIADTSPTANNVEVNRKPGESFKLHTSELLAACSDPGDLELGIESIDSTSTGAQTVTVSGDWIFYSPAADYNVSDSFSFSVTNTIGKSASGQVIITVVSADETRSISIAPDETTGNIAVMLRGIPGCAAILQATDDLVSGEWTDLKTGTFNAAGYFEYTETDAPDSRYYRLLLDQE